MFLRLRLSDGLRDYTAVKEKRVPAFQQLGLWGDRKGQRPLEERMEMRKLGVWGIGGAFLGNALRSEWRTSQQRQERDKEEKPLCKGWAARENGLSGCLWLRSDTSTFGCVAGDLYKSFTHFGERQLTSSYVGVLLSF